MKLTAVIIAPEKLTGNKDLKRAIKSVKFADEIIVRREREKIDDFSAIRNKLLNKAKGEWVLFLDSDEEVTSKLANEMSQVLTKLKIKNPRQGRGRQRSKIGYKVRRKDRFLGKWLRHGETSAVRLVRLARRKAGKWERPVHEVWKVKGGIGELKNPLNHYSYESIGEMVKKLDKYTSLEADYRQGISVSWWEPIVYPLGKFIKNYFFRFGFLDGMTGFIHALMMSFHSFLVRVKLCEKNF